MTTPEEDEAQAALRVTAQVSARLASEVAELRPLKAEVKRLTAERDTAKGLLAGLHKELRAAITAQGQAERERDEARAAVERVRAMHREREVYELDEHGEKTDKQWPSICEECSDEDVIGLLDIGELIHEGEGVPYPCPTIRALDGDPS